MNKPFYSVALLADPLAPGSGLGLWIAGRLAHGLGLHWRCAKSRHGWR